MDEIKHKIEPGAGPVLVVAPIGPFRDAVRKALKGIGFEDVVSVNTVQDALWQLEAEEIMPCWILTTPCLNDGMNALKMLRLILEEPLLRAINVSIFYEVADAPCIPAAFELGALSSHASVSRSPGEIDRELRTVIARASGQGWDMCKVSASYLREFLAMRKDWVSLVELERSLSRMYPGAPDQLMALAESLYLAGRADEARAAIVQAVQLEPAFANEAVALAKRLGVGVDNIDPQSKSNIAVLYEINSALVVDSDADSRVAVIRILKSMNVLNIQAFADSDSALTWASRSKEPGIIVMDWRVKGDIQGPAFLQRLRLRGWCVAPVVVLSSAVQDGHRHLLRELGVELIVRKPLDEAAFTRALMLSLRTNHFPASHKVTLRRIDEALVNGDARSARRIAQQIFGSPAKLPVDVQMFLEAKLAYAERNYVDAHKLIVRLTRIEPDNIRYQDLLGKVLLKMGDFDAAVMCFKKNDAVAPDNIQRLCEMAEAYTEMGEFDQAKENASQVRELDDDSPLLHEIEVKIGIHSKDYAAAKAAFVHMPDPNVLFSYMNNRAVALAKAGQHDRGIELYDDTMRVVPEENAEFQAILLYNSGLAHVRKGDLIGALRQFTDAISKAKGRMKFKVQSILEKVDQALGTGAKVTLEQTPLIHPQQFDPLKIMPGDARCAGIFEAPSGMGASRYAPDRPRFKKRDSIQRGSTTSMLKTGFS